MLRSIGSALSNRLYAQSEKQTAAEREKKSTSSSSENGSEAEYATISSSEVKRVDQQKVFLFTKARCDGTAEMKRVLGS